MNVERTIEFLLSHAARTEASLAEVSTQLAKVAANQARTDAILRRAIRLAVQRDRRVRGELRAMRSAQRRTDSRFDQLISNLAKSSGNGRRRGTA